MLLLLAAMTLSSCGGDSKELPVPDPDPVNPEPKPDPEPDPVDKYQPVANSEEGFNFDPVVPEAGKPLKITFRAPRESKLYSEMGDLYTHIGYNGWKAAPKWGNNDKKYLFKKNKQAHMWTLLIEPTVKEYFEMSSDKFTSLELIVRNKKGDKQTGDYSIIVGDAVSEGTLKGTCPVENEGVHIKSATEAIFTIFDCDKQGNHKENAFFLCDANNFRPSADYRMTYDESSHMWWIDIDNLRPGENKFQYLVYSRNSGTTYVCDPYSEKVIEKGSKAGGFPSEAGGNYVSVVNTQPTSYNWQVDNFKLENKQNLVIYEMLFRDFTKKGNIDGAIEKLDYLKNLGVNAVEIMPVQEFGGDDSWGYNTSFYFAMDRAYGEKNDYKRFIDECHKRGIGVIVDVVYNHTNDNSPHARLFWNIWSNRPSADSPYLNPVAPHASLKFGLDYNHESPRVQEFFKRNITFLLEEYRFDGLRFDFTKGFTQKKTGSMEALNQYDQSRVDLLKMYNAHVKTVNPDAVVIMEHLLGSEEAKLCEAGILCWNNCNNAYCQSAMGYPSNSDFRRMNNKRMVSYMESHDEERMGYKQTQWAVDPVKKSIAMRMQMLSANAAMALTVPGPKMIWQFGEMGYDVSINENGRCEKKPIHWEYLEEKDRKQLHDVYTMLLAIRNANPQLFAAPVEFKWQAGTSDWNNGRRLEISNSTKKLVVLANYTAHPIQMKIEAGEWTDMLSGKTQKVETEVKVPEFNFKVLGRNLAQE